MAKAPTQNNRDSETPKDFPGVTPRDLYPTSDIRFVLLEIGKLTSSVDRLISDVKSQSEKVDGLRHQVSFVKGALYVLAGVVALTAYLLSAKWDVILHAIQALAK